MAYRKKTLRTMSPTARKVARLTGELESVARRLKNLVPELRSLDISAKALETAKDSTRRGEYQAYMSTLAFILTYREDEGLPQDEVVAWLRARVELKIKQFTRPVLRG
jgi:hypothetical protein